MSKLLCLIFFSVIILTGCKKQDQEAGVPSCIIERIRSFGAVSCDKGASVKEYTFQGESVFAFDPGTCGADMTTDIYDSECTFQGSLNGITGNTKINGEEFSKAVFVRTLYSN